MVFLFASPCYAGKKTDCSGMEESGIKLEKVQNKYKNFKISIHIPLYVDPKKKQQLKNFKKQHLVPKQLFVEHVNAVLLVVDHFVLL